MNSADIFIFNNRIDLYNPSADAKNQRTVVISVAFRFDDGVPQPDKYKPRVIQALEEQILNPMRELKVSALVGQDDLKLLPVWMKKRLGKKIPRFVSIAHVTITDDSGNVLVHEVANTGKVLAESQPHDAGGVGAEDARDFLGFLESSALVCRVRENYNSKRELTRIETLLSEKKNGDRPLAICNFICPPYVGENASMVNRGYVSVSDDFFVPPKSYNFDYDYFNQIGLMEAAHGLATHDGFKIDPYLVLGDWGLIAIDRLRATNGNDGVIVESLNRFRNGMQKHLTDTGSPVRITSFQDIGASSFLPIGLPATVADRHEWINWVTTQKHDEDLARPLRPEKAQALLGLFKDPLALEGLLDWRNYDSLYTATVAADVSFPAISKAEFVDIAKVYTNVRNLRFAQLPSDEAERMKTAKDGSSIGHEFRAAAFVDTLVRHYQYQIYATLFSRKFGSSLCLYSDDAFSSCGHFFKTENMNVIFLDAKKLQTMKAVEAKRPLRPASDVKDHARHG
jgi:hypothetical protein